MLEFPGQVLELSMPVGRGHLWVQAWTDNDYLNLRALFYIITSSGRSPEELFLRSGNSPTSVCPSNWPSVNIFVIPSPPRPLVGCFWNLIRMFSSVSSCASTKKNSGPSANMTAVGHLWFFLLSHILKNYLTDLNETCLLSSTQCLVSARTEKIPVHRQIWPFGSRLGLSETLGMRIQIVRIPSKRQNIDHPCSGTKWISAV